YSKSAFTKGLREIKVIPGVYAKTGLNFEYSIEDKAIQAVEVGAQISGFPRQVPIMSGDNNKAIFFSLFVSYRIGIIVDPLSREKTGLLKIFNKKSDDIAVY
ncbi:MAG: hypothetical protein ACOX5K_07610, partial [Bacteroidales bacterium]